MTKVDFGKILSEGRIIDNRRQINGKTVSFRDVLNSIAIDSDALKCAVGYFYIEGLAQIIHSLKKLKEVKILMGVNTSKPTKDQLIRAFTKQFDEIDRDEETTSYVSLFYQLVKEYKTLKVRVYFGNGKNSVRLHSKAYLFLRDVESKSILDRYKAGIVGSSNLTPSGLVGNTELNVITTEPNDLQHLEKWFELLWKEGTEDFEKLHVAEALLKGIEKSQFGKDTQETFLYMEPKEFFKTLIKFLDADYLFEEFKKSKLLRFQYVDFLRVLNKFNAKEYRGVFLTSSVGLGKSYVASQIAKYFLHNNHKVMIIAPAGLIHDPEQWPRYLKEFDIFEKVRLVSMGDLQKNPNSATLKKYGGKYGLIIIDEAHNYRNEDTYRTRNLKKLIDENGNAKVMLLTATPINTSLYDLLNLIKLFHRKGDNFKFDKLVLDLGDLINTFERKEYEELTEIEKESLSKIQEEIEQELFVKSTRETIKTSDEYIAELKEFSGVDIREIPDPDVDEIKYGLDSRYKDIVAGIVPFIASLSTAHLRLLDPEKGSRLSGFFKWLLYKRFESDISSYYLTLKRLSKKNTLIKKAIDDKNLDVLEQDDEDDVNVNFELDYREKLRGVIEMIENGKGKAHLEILQELNADTKLIDEEIRKLSPFLKGDSNILFQHDQKISHLELCFKTYKNQKILVFTEYKDTLLAIREAIENKFDKETVKFIDSNTKNKGSIIGRFNDNNDSLQILISTDALAEGFNISGADVVINFDIPYNPVRIIQRIGRATRLDVPKKLVVLNIRPDDSIDVELNLVEKLRLRIKDIIRFIGVEYRIWFEAEKELLKERRRRDKKLYANSLDALKVLDRIRGSVRQGRLEKLDVPLQYTRGSLAILQRAIIKYGITKEESENSLVPEGKWYTLLKGDMDACFFYNDREAFNDEILRNVLLEEIEQRVQFEKKFSNSVANFNKHKKIQTEELVRLTYYTDRLDKNINTILDFIESEKLTELYPEAGQLTSLLQEVGERCGSTTEAMVKIIKQELRKKVTSPKLAQWCKGLKESFQKGIQKKLPKKKTTVFAIGLIR